MTVFESTNPRLPEKYRFAVKYRYEELKNSIQQDLLRWRERLWNITFNHDLALTAHEALDESQFKQFLKE